MATLKEECPICHKTAKMKYETPLGSKLIRAYTCGHTEFVDRPPEPSPEDLAKIPTYLESQFEENQLSQFDDDGNCINYSSLDASFFSLDGEKCAYPFQVSGVHFAEKADFRCLIADQTGLGKTVQAGIVVKRNKRLWPALFIVKGSTILQFTKELKDWVNNEPLGIMPILNRESIIPGFNFYLISMDFISRKGVLERLLALNLKCVVMDECQGYKDSSSKRTKALIDLIQQGKIHHRLALSATPIKNRATEYFTILNLLDPQRFYSYAAFVSNWLVANEKGVYTKIAPWRLEEFHQVTSKYIIRREKHEVLKDLPPLRREFILVEIDDPDIKNIYNAEIDLFSNFLRTAGKVKSTVLLGWLAKMRAIAGQAKVSWAVDYIQEVMDTSDESLLLGIHHHSVRDTLYMATKAFGYDPLKLSGEDSIWQKDRVQDSFNAGRNRLLIANMLAGGVGLNLQKACHHGLVLERAWNSVDEEQFEGRIFRDGQKYPVEMTYAIAAGTIDEWYHAMILSKKKVVGQTMNDTVIDIESDEEALKALVERTLENKLK